MTVSALSGRSMSVDGAPDLLRTAGSGHIGTPPSPATAAVSAEPAAQGQFGLVLQRVSCLEEELAQVQYERVEADRRHARVTEQLSRLSQELAESRRAGAAALDPAAERRQGCRGPLGGGARHALPPLPLSSPKVAEACAEEPEDEMQPELPPAPKVGRENSQANLNGSALAASIRQAEAQLRRATADARRTEASVRCEIGHAVAEARAFLHSEWGRHRVGLTPHTSGEDASGVPPHEASVDSSTQAPSLSSAATVECLGVRLEALEVHVRARMESVEEMVGGVGGRCDALAAALSRLGARPLEAESLIRRGLDSARAEWRAALEGERRRATDREQVLARALGSEIEASVVQQAVAEVRAEVRASARSEMKDLNEQCAHHGKVLEALQAQRLMTPPLNTPTGGSSSASTTSTLPADPVSLAISTTYDLTKPQQGALVLQQLGQSVVQLECSITSLLRSSTAAVDARSEQQKETAALRRDAEELKTEVKRLGGTVLPALHAQVDSLQANFDAEVQRRDDCSQNGNQLLCEETCRLSNELFTRMATERTCRELNERGFGQRLTAAEGVLTELRREVNASMAQVSKEVSCVATLSQELLEHCCHDGAAIQQSMNEVVRKLRTAQRAMSPGPAEPRSGSMSPKATRTRSPSRHPMLPLRAPSAGPLHSPLHSPPQGPRSPLGRQPTQGLAPPPLLPAATAVTALGESVGNLAATHDAAAAAPVTVSVMVPGAPLGAADAERAAALHPAWTRSVSRSVSAPSMDPGVRSPTPLPVSAAVAEEGAKPAPSPVRTAQAPIAAEAPVASPSRLRSPTGSVAPQHSGGCAVPFGHVAVAAASSRSGSRARGAGAGAGAGAWSPPGGGDPRAGSATVPAGALSASRRNCATPLCSVRGGSGITGSLRNLP